MNQNLFMGLLTWLYSLPSYLSKSENKYTSEGKKSQYSKYFEINVTLLSLCGITSAEKRAVEQC